VRAATSEAEERDIWDVAQLTLAIVLLFLVVLLGAMAVRRRGE